MAVFAKYSQPLDGSGGRFYETVPPGAGEIAAMCKTSPEDEHVYMNMYMYMFALEDTYISK